MNEDVPIISTQKLYFPSKPDSARFAILLPTVRTDAICRTVIGGLLGVANEELIILIADNSEDSEKREFLARICQINPNILAIQHEKNIGARANFTFLFDWSEGVEFVALMGDDDWVSPEYHSAAFKLLAESPRVAAASLGNTIIMLDNRPIDGNQPSMIGDTPLSRMKKWDATAGRVTAYNASRRAALKNAFSYLSASPIGGITLLENLWGLNRLARGDFITKIEGAGFMVHIPYHLFSISGERAERFFEHLHGGSDLTFPYYYFSHLGTAIQCALFLLGKLSPLDSGQEREECANYVFDHVFKKAFLTHVRGNEQAALSLFAGHEEVIEGFQKYCLPPLPNKLNFNKDVLDWYIKLVAVLQKSKGDLQSSSSEKFKKFSSELLGGTANG